MSRLSSPLSWGLGVLCATLLVQSVQAQGIRPAAASRNISRGRVSQMEIFDGTRRTVRYFSENLSPGETSTLREMERLENESIYISDLQNLKKQYVNGERLLELHRRLVQQQLYGLQTTHNLYGSTYSGYYATPGYSGLPYVTTGTVGLTAVAGDSLTVTRSLDHGVGTEGRIKDAMALILAQQATPDYANTIDRSIDRVALRASASPTLRAALNLPSTEENLREKDNYRLVVGDVAPQGPITLTLKDGEKIVASSMQEKGDWILIDKIDGGKSRIRMTEVTRIDMAATKKVVPAAHQR